MDLYLVCTDLDLTIEIPLPQDRSSQIASQLSRIKERGDRRGFQIRLAEEVAKIIPDLTDWDLKPPTRAQLQWHRCCYCKAARLPTVKKQYFKCARHVQVLLRPWSRRRSSEPGHAKLTASSSRSSATSYTDRSWQSTSRCVAASYPYKMPAVRLQRSMQDHAT